MYLCNACGRELPLCDKPGRRDCCPYCEAALHCCLNCRFFSPALSNQCQEPQAEWVVNKKRGNFCDFFEYKSAEQVRQIKQGQDTARANFDDLFKKPQKE